MHARVTGARTLRRRLRLTPRMQLGLVVVLMLGGLLFGAWIWLRDSSLVGIDRVTINGVSGADASAIRAALRSAARNMTSLDVKLNQLETSVAPFPEVKRLRVRTAFPHRLVIDVVEQRPVAVVEVGGRQVPVAADGTLLRTLTTSGRLPSIPLAVPPVGRRLSEGRAAEAVAVLAAAPSPLLARISQVTTVAGRGLVAQLRNGPSIYFGDTSRLRAKWLAASEVLADTSSAGAAYVDVTDPERPAAGAGTAASGGLAGASSSAGGAPSGAVAGGPATPTGG
jgi:cell division protein FtsQ